jgi:histidyl-tRNA synthetase
MWDGARPPERRANRRRVSKTTLQAPRGTRDFYPDDLRRREWLFEHFRTVAKSFAFEEIDAPVVEHAELFTRKAGEEIVDQLYHFTMHDRHLSLRGEMTPSTARMVMARANGLAFPLRWFSLCQMWRYERMTRGRRREHFQWEMDVWGEPDVTAEAELIAAIFSLLARLGLEPGEVAVRVNSRALLEETLAADVLRKKPEAFAPLCIVIDKLGKIGADAVVDQLTDEKGLIGLSKDAAQSVIAMLGAGTLDEAASYAPADSQALRDLRRLMELADAYGYGEHVVFDASIVRGLAYYTGIVFEAFDKAGSLRSICGGGRFDKLVESLGGSPITAVGFGFGDSVIAELLTDRGLWPELSRPVDDVVFAREEAQRPLAIRVASRLRGEGRRVEMVLGSVSQKRAFKDADRAGAARIWLIGPDEVERGMARVRDLKTGEQSDVPLEDPKA